MNVRLFGSLCEKLGEHRTVDLAPCSTVKELLASLGLDERRISLTVVNGVQVGLTSELSDGDQVMIVQPVIGG